MDLQLFATVLVVIGVLGSAVTYGTDTFAGAVWNAALGKLDDRALTQVVGWVHYYGDRRLPIPGAIGTVATALSAVVAWIDGDLSAAVLRTVASVLAFAWLALYVRVAQPINKRFSAAALENRVLDSAVQEQSAWNRIIPIRVGLLAGVLGLLTVSLA